MGILEETYRRSQGIEEKFKHKKILFIPSESYGSAILTVMQGLEELGFSVYTIGKSNINSWWFNKVIDEPGSRRFDFVLSGLLHGVRWEFYDRYKLHGYVKVLIDDVDNKGFDTWRDKYAFYDHRYKRNTKPPESVLNEDIQPCRWMEPLGNYEPDIVFTGQRNPFDQETFYLPFGIYREALDLCEGKPGPERSIDFANLPGNGDGREKLTKFIAQGRLPGKVHNSKVFGNTIVPEKIKHLAKKDRDKVHDYRMWVLHRNYFRMLNDTKVFIYSNVSHRAPHWDSNRQWEALASDCLCLFEQPNVGMAQYPVTELCPEVQFANYDELVDKANWLYSDQRRLEQLRLQAHERALRYFTPIPLTRYFLWRIWTETSP